MSSRMSAEKIQALTLAEIIRLKYSPKIIENKILVRLEGFSYRVYEHFSAINELNRYNIYWASDIPGEELVQKRNDDNYLKPLIIFIDTFFPESQSLAHFNLLSDEHILRAPENLNVLIRKSFSSILNVEAQEKIIFEATKKIVDIINPSLDSLSYFLVEVAKLSKESNNIEENFGNSLWALGLFSYKNLIKQTIYSNPTDPSEYLKQNFKSLIKHNHNLTSPAYRGWFTNERIFQSDFSEEEKMTIIDYSLGYKKDECLKTVDFEKIKNMLKTKNSEKPRQSSMESEEMEFDILQIIAKHFEEGGRYEIQFSEDHKVTINCKPIPFPNILSPIPDFQQYTEGWVKYVAGIKSESNSNLEDENYEISISALRENSEQSIPIPIKKPEIYNFKSHKDWLELEGLSKHQDIYDLIKDFLKIRKTVIDSMRFTGTLTLHLNLSEYLIGFLNLIKKLWDQANIWAEHKWFQILIKEITKLDTREDDGNLIVLPVHPYALLVQRVSELIKLNLIDSNLNKENSITEYFEKEILSNYGRTWPLYLANQENDQPLTLNITDKGLQYNINSVSGTQHSTLQNVLPPQIEAYLKEHPLARHTFLLKVLNPTNGQELFQVLNKLSSKSHPEYVSLIAIGPETHDTLHFFDKKAEVKHKEPMTMFMKRPGQLNPYLRYEKILVRSESNDEWIDNWMSFYSEDKHGDICVAIDPFASKYKVYDQFMQKERSNAIDKYFEDFNTESEESDLWDFLTGPDRIHLRLCLEALSIMGEKRGAERRYFIKESEGCKYEQLMKRMKETNEWAIVMDHNLNEYDVEQISTKIEKQIDEPVSNLVYESSRGIAYILITPPQKSILEREMKNIPFHLKDKRNFIHWYISLYKNFSEASNFSEVFFSDDRQWLIPVSHLPELIIKMMIANLCNEDEDSNKAEDFFENLNLYILRLIFREDSSGFIAFEEILYKKEKTELIEVSAKDVNVFPSSSNNEFNIIDDLKQKILFKSLQTFTINPYQAWFLALLRRGEVEFKRKRNLHFFQKNPQYATSIASLETWRLRNLSIQLLKLYSENPGFSADERQTLMSLFDRINKNNPQFINTCLNHLKRMRPEVFLAMEFLEDYMDNETKQKK